VAVNCCVLPAATDAVAGMMAIEVNNGAVPVPASATFCGLEDPVSTITSVAARDPRASGVKVTAIVQPAPGARVAGLTGQLLTAA
jgi:hypothetical protein